MKNLLVIIAILMICVGSQAEDILLSSEAQFLDFDEIPGSLAEILFCINAIIYENEDGDDWKSPIRTLSHGKGDCEDKAFLGSYFAEKLGYEPIVLDITWKAGGKAGHMVTFLKKNGKYGLIDENILIYPTHKSINEVCRIYNKYSDSKIEWYGLIRLGHTDWKYERYNLKSKLNKNTLYAGYK